MYFGPKDISNASIYHWKCNEAVFLLHWFSGEQIKVGEVFDTYKTHNSEDARGIYLLANEPFRTGVIYQWVKNVIYFSSTHEIKEILKCNYFDIKKYSNKNNHCAHVEKSSQILICKNGIKGFSSSKKIQCIELMDTGSKV